MTLLSNFPEDEATKTLFEKIKALNIPQLNVELIRLGIVKNSFSQQEIQEALDNSKTRYITIQLLINKGKNELLKNVSDEEIAKSAVINFEGLLEKDAIRLISQQIVMFKGNEVTYYFFEIIKKVKQKDVVKKKLYAIAFVNENKKINPLAYKNFGSEIIEETDDISKKCQEIITANLNQKHYRASFKKQVEVNPNSYLGDY